MLLVTPLSVLGKVLGEKPGSFVLSHLGGNIPCPEHGEEAGFETYQNILWRLLGPSSAIIKKLILKVLFIRFELKFTEKERYRFQDYMKELGNVGEASY
jgi:hypothetical protein